MQGIKNYSIIYVLGFILYMLIELLWRGHTHWSMGIVGGLCFLIIFSLSKRRRGRNLTVTCLLGALSISIIELLSGLLINVGLGWGVWDYSDLFGNIAGQVCIIYSCLWFFLSIPVVFFSYYLMEKLEFS